MRCSLVGDCLPHFIAQFVQIQPLEQGLASPETIRLLGRLRRSGPLRGLVLREPP